MKRTVNSDLLLKISVILIFIIIVCIAAFKLIGVERSIKGTEITTKTIPVSSTYIKGIWITYTDLPSLNIDKKEYKSQVENIFKTIASKGYNTAFVHVIPFANVKCNLLNSELNPLKIICDTANKYKISVHAWINPYRVTYNITYLLSSEMICTPSVVMYDPGNPKTLKIISEYIKALLKYDISGIHIDDYFYPADIGDFDSTSFSLSKTSLSIEDWRRENVTKMIKKISDLLPDNICFSVSPAADINKNYSVYYADIKTWCNQGYIDMIIPQIYFGFNNATMPFDSVLNSWASGGYATDKCKLLIGLPAYKQGQPDQFAGSGKDEFINDNNVIKKQIEHVSACSTCSGYVMYSYSSIK